VFKIERLSDRNIFRFSKRVQKLERHIKSIAVTAGIIFDNFSYPGYPTVFLCFQISEGDALTKICTDCLVQVESFGTFRNNCLQNDAKIKEIFGIQEVLQQESDDDLPEIIMLDPSKVYESESEAEDPVIETNPPVVQLPKEEKEEVIPAISTIAPPQPIVEQPAASQPATNPVKYFLCKYCDICFCNLSDCQLHENTQHDKLTPYSCNICPYKSDSKNTIVFHIREFHQIQRAFICVLCNKGFNRRSDLKKHTFQHAGIRPYACNICGKTFSRNTNLSKHKRSLHSGLKTQACTICPRQFSNKSDLVRHLEIHQESRWICKFCNQAFIRRDKLLHHEKSHLQQIQQAPEAQQIPAPPQPAPAQPSQAQQSQYNYQPNFYTENMVIDLNPFEQDQQQQPQPNQWKSQPQPAPQITHSKPIETYVVSHQTADHSPSNEALMLKYKCEHCGRFFSTVLLLQNHLTTHLQSFMRPFTCSQCSASFSKKKELVRHEQSMHCDFKAFPCTVSGCGKIFSRRDKLLRHEKIHLNQKIYSCSLCPAVFLSSHSLHIHEKVHDTSEPPQPFDPQLFQTPKTFKALEESDDENKLKIVEDDEPAKKIPRLIPFNQESLEKPETSLVVDQEWLRNYAKDSKIEELDENLSDLLPFDLSKHEELIQLPQETEKNCLEALDYSTKSQDNSEIVRMDLDSSQVQVPVLAEPQKLEEHVNGDFAGEEKTNFNENTD
jgi:uncharacterized Zn-finger protein